MPRKRKQQSQPTSEAAPTDAKPKRTAPRINNPVLPPDALKRMRKFYSDTYLIERQWLRVIGY